VTAEPATSSPPAPARRYLWLVLLVAVVARSGVLIAEFASLAADPDSYRQLAENLVAHGTFGVGDRPTAYRPPLWPLLLVPCVLGSEGVEFRLALLQFVLGLATVGLVWQLARRWEVGRTAWVAPLLVAVDPILLRQSTVVMTETLATLLAALSLVALSAAAEKLTIRRAIGAGICLGLAALCRPTFLPWLALMPILFFIGVQGRRVAGFKQGVLVLAGGALVLAPWVVRNFATFGKPIIGTTHGGYTLLLGNNPSFYEYARNGAWGEPWDATEFQSGLARDLAAETSPSDELARDRLIYAQAQDNIAAASTDFLRASVLRLAYLFSPMPHQLGTSPSAKQTLVRFGIAMFYLAEFAFALIAVFYLRGRLLRSPWLWGVSLVACFASVHFLYWTDMRMRAPLVPVIALLAASGTRLLDRRDAPA